MILTIAEGASPYAKHLLGTNQLGSADVNASLHYYKGAFLIAYGDKCYSLNNDGSILQEYEATNTTTLANEMITHPVPVINQGSANCVDHAVATLLLYWHQSGYSNLVPSFTNTREQIRVLRINNGGNNALAGVIRTYASTQGYNIYPAGSWNPSWTYYRGRIIAGKVSLLGFASVYGAPHMTVGAGYATISGINYSVVCDGHSSMRVYKVWSSDNDFMLLAGF
jgi:hypothetical protein